MKAALSLVLVLAAASVVSGHVIAVYQGMNLKIRSGTGTSDGTPTVAGPCGGSIVFGANGINEITPGETINLQLKYQQAHPNPPAGNFFSVGMICTKGATTALNSDSTLRLWDTTTANGVTTMKNQVNNVGINPVFVPAQDVQNIPFTFPSKSPAGESLSSGDHCVISIMDQRNWGGCIDVVVGSQPGPIIAGVVTPVIGVGAAAAIFFGRGAIAAKLVPTPAEAVPEKRMFRTIFIAFTTMIVAIVATALPKWSIGPNFTSGPWSMCVDGRDCYDPIITGNSAYYAVRVFTLTNVFAAIFSVLFPVIAFYGRMEGSHAALGQLIMFIYMGASAFAAMIIWLSIMLNGNGVGGGLACDIVVFIFGIIGSMLSYQWMKAIEVAPKETLSPIMTGVSTTPAATAAPVSYPKTGVAASASASSPRATPAAAAATPSYPKAKAVQPPGKWGDWEELYDKENQAYYFFNHSNGESLWEPPEGWPHPPREV